MNSRHEAATGISLWETGRTRGDLANEDGVSERALPCCSGASLTGNRCG